jgi:hypothetical protein
MKRSRPQITTVLLMATLLLSACGGAVSDEHVVNEPVRVEPIKGTDLSRVTLTARAAGRLDIRTAPVEESGKWMVVPSGALLVDPNGDYWVYTNPEPFVFVRHEISIDHEDGDQAFLLAGPPAGTQVATVGVAELYGAEFGMGH